MSRQIRTSAKAVIIRDGKLLAIKLNDGKEEWYILPGGGQDVEEMLPQTVEREVREETGIEIKCKELLFVIEGVHGESFHRIDLVFLCDYLREAKNAGFEAIVLTSHYKEGYYETDTKEREVWVNAIYENLRAKNIDVKIYLGNEIYMSDNIIKLLEDEKASTINDTSYVLFELPLDEEPENLYDKIHQMKQCKIVPILAHPERYKFVQKDPDLLYELIENGVLIQADYGSIIG